MEHESTLLIIDDQAESLGWLHDLFLRSGYKVLLADSGELALSAAPSSKPDLILLDVLMPGLDGYETCRRLKSNESTRDIPVIFLSSLDDAQDRIKGFQAGGIDFIQKPFNEEEALLRVRTQTDLRRLRLKLEEEVLRRTQALEEEIAVRIEVESRLRKSIGENGMLMRELQHRVKNSFSMILSLVRVTVPVTGDPIITAYLETLVSRIRSMSALYDLLYEKGTMAEIPLDDYLGRIAHTLMSFDDRHQLEICMVPVKAGMDIAAPLGLIVTELLTNSLKYAYPDGQSGSIRISLDSNDNVAVLRLDDDGIGSTAQASMAGSGTGLLLVRSLCEQIDAELSVSGERGFHIAIRFALCISR